MFCWNLDGVFSFYLNDGMESNKDIWFVLPRVNTSTLFFPFSVPQEIFFISTEASNYFWISHAICCEGYLYGRNRLCG